MPPSTNTCLEGDRPENDLQQNLMRATAAAATKKNPKLGYALGVVRSCCLKR